MGSGRQLLPTGTVGIPKAAVPGWMWAVSPSLTMSVPQRHLQCSRSCSLFLTPWLAVQVLRGASASHLVSIHCPGRDEHTQIPQLEFASSAGQKG